MDNYVMTKAHYLNAKMLLTSEDAAERASATREIADLEVVIDRLAVPRATDGTPLWIEV